jgi:hypothetical protein
LFSLSVEYNLHLFFLFPVTPIEREDEEERGGEPEKKGIKIKIQQRQRGSA